MIGLMGWTSPVVVAIDDLPLIIALLFSRRESAEEYVTRDGVQTTAF